MKIINDWINFFSFLKTPDYLTNKDSVLSKLFLTFNSLILFVLLFIPTIIIYTIYTALLDDSPKSLHQNVLKLYHPVILYTLIAVYEEFSFRGFLTKFNPLLFSISTTGIIALYFKKIVFRNMMFEPEGFKEVCILILVLFPIFFLIAKTNTQIFNRFWEKHFKSIVYTSAFLFAFVHFFNSVDLSLSYLPTTVFQFIMAFIFSYVRTRSGIAFAIIIHFIWNLMIYGI
ncbi:MAG: hypothetical protein COA88_09495 [Kordia sp.]|nr:MAG: hypothetical protein COA88_09495 [Kordia sp.]